MSLDLHNCCTCHLLFLIPLNLPVSPGSIREVHCEGRPGGAFSLNRPSKSRTFRTHIIWQAT
jgi:hypothetical protein